MTPSPPQPPVSGGGADPAPSAAERMSAKDADYVRTLRYRHGDRYSPTCEACRLLAIIDHLLVPADPPMTTRLADGTLAKLERIETNVGQHVRLYRLVPADRLSGGAEPDGRGLSESPNERSEPVE